LLHEARYLNKWKMIDATEFIPSAQLSVDQR
jgi:hypothetical protein